MKWKALRTSFDMCALKCSDVHLPPIGTKTPFLRYTNVSLFAKYSGSKYKPISLFSVFMFLEPGFPIWLNPIWHDIVSEKGLGTHTCTADGLEKGHYAWQKAGLSFRMICKKGTLCQINSLFYIEVTQREEVVPYRIQ